MVITVTDANIFIDLIKLNMLGYLFGVELEIHTSSEIIDQLNESQQQQVSVFIHSRSLNVTYFTVDEIEEIQAETFPRALEFQDKTVYYLAKKIDAQVLTGDSALRKFCITKQLTVHGIVWLFDRLLEKGLINSAVAINKMEHLLSFNDRLPKSECLKRIQEWGLL